MSASNNKLMLTFKIMRVIAVVCWLSIIWGIRGLSQDPTVVWVLGFAPDFFAAVALFFDAIDRTARSRGFEVIQARSNWLIVSVGVCAQLFVGELLQEYVFWGSFDWWDVAAHVVGVGVSSAIMAVLFSYAPNATKNSTPDWAVRG
ncbi:MAG TPA: hypothetical protein DDW52_19905 [Planctomycetaceae bacterium]|nr:hypothetical protein [Planctomycetaceae bacterium]